MTKFLNISTDNTLGGSSASDETVSSQKAVKDYIDSKAPEVDGISITQNSSDELQTVGVIDQNNTSNAIKTWTGTKAQYDAIVSKDVGTLYNITDDTSVFDILGAIYPVGSIYIGTMATCPLAALLGTWTLVGTKLVTNVDSTAGVKGNGMAVGLTNGTNTAGMRSNSSYGVDLGQNSYGASVGDTSSGGTTLGNITIGITTDPTKSGIEATVTSSSLTVNIWKRTA